MNIVINLLFQSPALSIVRILLFMTLLAVAGPVRAQQSQQIQVGPNILVGRESDGTSWEHFVAADPTNPQNLFGSAMVTRTNRQIGEDKSRGYLSRDGGYSWRTITFPEVAGTVDGDPVVAYGKTGSVIFARGHHVWRSADGGSTWDTPRFVYIVDRPQIVADHTNGRYSGRIYINAMISPFVIFRQSPSHRYGRDDYHVGMFRSEDDGRTWIGPVTVATNHDLLGRGLLGLQPLVFTDGDLFAPFDSFPFSDQERTAAKSLKLPSFYYGFALSKDGGATFAQHQSLKTQADVDIKGNSRPFFAGDTSEGPFRDRAYVAFADKNVHIDEDGKVAYLDNADPKPARIFVSHSSDKGKTWSTPKMISPVEKGDQFDISIAVNKGTVLVSYHDTRDTPPGKEGVLLNRYVSVSVDGGETFLPARRITSVPSDPTALHNNLAGPEAIGFSISFNSGASRYADYQGIATDLNGMFHPFWSDGRTGMNQTWTVAIRVERPDTTGVQRTVKPPELIEADITKMLEVSFDPLHPFPPAGTIELPIRLKNKSDKPIHGPIRAEAIAGSVKDFFKLHLLNSLDGKTMDYTPALGDSGVLEPGAISEGVVWRMKAPTSHKEFPNFDLKITGRIERPKDAAKTTAQKQ